MGGTSGTGQETVFVAMCGDVTEQKTSSRHVLTQL